MTKTHRRQTTLPALQAWKARVVAPLGPLDGFDVIELQSVTRVNWKSITVDVKGG